MIADAFERQSELALRAHQIPEMLDRLHFVELGGAGSRCADHGLAGRVGYKMHMKFAQTQPLTWDKTAFRDESVHETGPSLGPLKPCTFASAIATISAPADEIPSPGDAMGESRSRIGSIPETHKPL